METTPVQVRLRKETMDRLDRLVALTGENRTQTIVSALWLLERFAKAQTSGDRILLEAKDGSQTLLEIIGLDMLPVPSPST